jgi:hypothetical protein
MPIELPVLPGGILLQKPKVTDSPQPSTPSGQQIKISIPASTPPTPKTTFTPKRKVYHFFVDFIFPIGCYENYVGVKHLWLKRKMYTIEICVTSQTLSEIHFHNSSVLNAEIFF